LANHSFKSVNFSVVIMKQYTYRILLTPEDKGGFSVSIPTLPGCFTQGEIVQESIEMAKEAINLYIENLKEDGEIVPDDSNTLEYLLLFVS
jgi:antitoxin HicB